MNRRFLLALGVSFLSFTVCGAAERRKPITQPKYDPSAPRVEFFDGLDNQSIEAELRPRNEFGGNVFIRNLTDEPITVVLPDAVVGLHVHPQGFLNQGNQGFQNGANQGQGFGGGQNQAVSGAFGGPGGSGIGPNGGQQNFFSIPAAATVRLPFQSVCLEHGKTTPTPRNSYRLVRTEEYSDKPELKLISRAIAEGKLDRQTIQAAAWHITSDMSWEDLASKKFDRAAAANTPYFTKSQLAAARELVSRATKQPGGTVQTAQQKPAPSVRSSASPE